MEKYLITRPALVVNPCQTVRFAITSTMSGQPAAGASIRDNIWVSVPQRLEIGVSNKHTQPSTVI